MENQEHVPLFVNFFKTIPFCFLLIGGVLDAALNLYLSPLNVSYPDLVGAIFYLVMFVPVAILLRYLANNLLVKRVSELFSEAKGKTKCLFNNDKDFKSFTKKAKSFMKSKKEYYFIAAFLIFLGATHQTTLAFVAGRGNEILQNLLTVESLRMLYSAIYWAFAASALASVIFSVIGFTVLMFNLKKSQIAFKISQSIDELKKALTSLRVKGAAEIDFDFVDLSFGELKESLMLLQKLGYDLAVGCAVIGFAYSMPAILYFLITRNLSNTVYGGFIAFAAVISITVFAATEIGIRRVWTSSKSEAMSILEQLCDRVKLRCVKSICKLESYQSREDSAKDVAFVRSAISDLKEIKASDLTLRTLAQIATTVILPYIPLVLKVLGVY